MILHVEDIKSIHKRANGKGYEIVFNDERIIHITKRRTIIALLILIEYGSGCESDLTAGSERLAEIKRLLNGKYPEGMIQDSYGDANKPFSELWNEEGFSWIENPSGQKRNGSQLYLLNPEHHDLLFESVLKAHRAAPRKHIQTDILNKQNNRCNICGAIIKTKTNILKSDFCKDRIRIVWDHRVPVEKGGNSENPDDYQALCFYCNKSKWQVCSNCRLVACPNTCVLAYPENSNCISPTAEDISDRMNRR